MADRTPSTPQVTIPMEYTTTPTPRPPETPSQPSGSPSSGRFQSTPRSSNTPRRTATPVPQEETSTALSPTVSRSIQAIVFTSWLNILLVFIPISWAINFVLPNQHALIFIFSFLAIIPLAKLLAFATDELSLRVGHTLAGLLNATLGNVAELIIAIIALQKCQLIIIRSSFVGFILSKLLVVQGMCFFAGGLRFAELGFDPSAVPLSSSLLIISVIAVLLPGAFHVAMQGLPHYDKFSPDHAISKASHGIVVILPLIYAAYMVFQLFSHSAFYVNNGEDVQSSAGENLLPLHRRRTRNIISDDSTRNREAATHHEGAIPDEERNGLSDSSVVTRAPEQSHMSVGVSFSLLVIVTVLVAVTAEFLIDSIDGLTESGTISKEFVGVILLPMIGNVVEGATAAVASAQDTLKLAVVVAVGASIQLALFVIPLVVILGWILNKPLTLLFDPLESAAIFLSVLTVNYVVQGGKSNWMKGVILICLYMILAVTFWCYPGTFGTSTQC